MNKNCKTRAPVPNNEHNKGKGKVNVGNTKEVNQTWKKKVENGSSGKNEIKVTQSNG